MSATDQLAVLPHGSRVPAHLVDPLKRFLDESKARATRRAYRGDLRRFRDWCKDEGLQRFPAAPEVVAAYATYLAEVKARKVPTIQRALAAIAKAHKVAREQDPGRYGQLRDPTKSELVRDTMAGIRREVGMARRKAKPLLPEHIKAACRALPEDSRGLQDRAFITVGFAGGGRRRSEMVACDVDDFDFTDDGLVMHVQRSKTDQEGVGFTVGIPPSQDQAACPVRLLNQWLELGGISAGAAFRAIFYGGQVTERRASDKAVCRAVKRACEAIGLDPAGYSAHSLRTGFITAAAQAKKAEHRIMRQSGHTSIAVFRGYIEDAGLFEENAAEGLL